MKNSTFRISKAAALIVGLCGSNSYGQAVIEKSEVRIIEQIYQILDKDMVKVTFDEGSATMPSGSMTAVADFVKATKDEAKVERYIVAAWADKDLPAKGGLSKGQSKLAKMRADHIKKTLEGAGVTQVDTFEMTSQPNWIQRTFSTETAEIKDKGMSVTNNERLLKDIGQRLRNAGGPHTAVIVAKFKNEVMAK